MPVEPPPSARPDLPDLGATPDLIHTVGAEPPPVSLAKRFGHRAGLAGVCAASLMSVTAIALNAWAGNLPATAHASAMFATGGLAAILAGLFGGSEGRRLQAVLNRDCSELRSHRAPGKLKGLHWLHKNLAEAVEARLAENAEALAEAEWLAFHDRDTGLQNRISLEREMQRALSDSDGSHAVGLIILDLDGFGRAQQMLGADGARDILNIASERLARETGATAGDQSNATLVARIGNDEFAILLRAGYNREGAARLAEALRRVLRAPMDIRGKMVALGVSGGIAMAPEDGGTAAELLHNAQLALDRVRSDGNTGFRFYTPRLNRVAQGRLKLEAELRNAVDRGEFVSVFQPKISFETGQVVGAEALVRWPRASGGQISPAAFIPLAEEIGLIDRIDRLIMTQACEACARWNARGHDVNIAVNVSPKDLERDDYVRGVVDRLARSGLHPEKLELEITETMAVSNPQRVTEVMQPLRSMGVRLTIDDFGAGHSNLSLLTRLPFDVFKIDRQFVRALSHDSHAPAIIEMILAMAETLGLSTVAEGVETAQQADFLSRRGCALAQGFLYSPAVSDEDFVALLDRWGAGQARAAS